MSDQLELTEVNTETIETPASFGSREERKEALIKRLEEGTEPLSFSALKAFAESPMKFIEYKLKERVETPAMLFGSVLHCLILEPDEFIKRYAIAPACDRRTKEGKEKFAAFLETAGDKKVLTAECYLDAKELKKAVYDNAPARHKLYACDEAEKKIEWEFMNFKFRGILDKTKQGKLILDLKKVVDANPRKAHRTIVDMGYHLQAAMYLTGVGEKTPYNIIAVDGDKGVSVHLLEEKLIDSGMEMYKTLMDKINSCILLNAWDKNFDFYSPRKDGLFVCEKPAYLY